MSKTGRQNYRRTDKRRARSARPERRVTVRSVRRDPPDLRKLSRAVIALAMAEAEAEKAARDTTPIDGAAVEYADRTDDPEAHHDD